jgi:hypothetical protein
MFLIAGSIPNTTDTYHYELKVERLILEGNNEEACHVGEKSIKSSKRLTEIRMYALAKTGQLGEKIFEYPQYYGTNGLLDINDKDSIYRLKLDDICTSIGAICGSTIKNTQTYLKKVINTDTLCTDIAIEYYLCYMLLDKNLKDFSYNIYKYYNPDKTRLPKAYQEALLYKADLEGDSLNFIDKEIYAKFREYKQLKAENLDQIKRKNKTRRIFGKTFWWYYENQEINDDND